jgi:AraC-like DNA-binding protein
MLNNKRFLPNHPLLQPVVDCFQVMECPPLTFSRSIPNTRIDGWVLLEGSFEIDMEGLGFYRSVPTAAFVPMSDHPMFFRTFEGFRVINIKCFPHLLGLLAFTPASLGDIVSFDVFSSKRDIDILLKNLHHAVSVDKKVTCLENFMVDCLLKNKMPDEWLLTVLNKIGLEAPIPINVLAAQAFMSVKTFERRFQRLTGLKPKLFHKLSRFQQVLKAIQQTPPGHSTVHPIWQTGYYDQSHFIKDCRAISGLPPGQLLARLPDFVTDLVLLD